ncbi:hypothetical protein [Xanthomonas tesorieronis]|uniref:hypothetical protein n=1 Tax=Xanthomonas tesorieronis TaxID=3160839 RepID=UPI003512984D
MQQWPIVADLAVKLCLAGQPANLDFHDRTIALTAKRHAGPTGTTRSQWLEIERAAAEELQRRTDAAHAAILELLRRHAQEFSPRQIAGLRRRLRKGR